MDKVIYLSQYHEDYYDQLKMGLLYFDNLEIPLYYQTLGHPVYPTPNIVDVYDDHYFISERFKTEITDLVENGIINYREIEFEGLRNGKPLVSIDAKSNDIEKFVLENIPMFFKTVSINPNSKGGLSYSGEGLDELDSFQEFLWADKNGSPGMLRYGARQLTTFLEALSNNETCLITGDFLHNLLSSYIASKKFNNFSNNNQLRNAVNASVAFNAIKLAIPNISSLSFEQILDLKFKLRDELASFKVEVERIVLELEFSTPISEIYKKSGEVVKVKIQPILDDLIKKMKSVVTYKDLLENIKDPKSYAPLLLSLTNNFSNTQILLSSLGLISFSTALNFYEKNKEIQANGHYYLLKLSQFK